MPTETPTITVTQAAIELGLTRRGVLNRIAAGSLPASKTGAGTAVWLIARADLDRAKAERSAAP